jgi:hypothetical protein
MPCIPGTFDRVLRTMQREELRTTLAEQLVQNAPELLSPDSIPAMLGGVFTAMQKLHLELQYFREKSPWQIVQGRKVLRDGPYKVVQGRLFQTPVIGGVRHELPISEEARSNGVWYSCSELRGRDQKSPREKFYMWVVFEYVW